MTIRTRLPALAGPMLAVAAALIAAAAEAAPEDRAEGDWEVTLGAGLVVHPEYEGGDEMAYDPLPLVDVTWRDLLFLNPSGFGAYAVNSETAEAGLSIGYAPGRDEDDGDRLDGTGDIAWGARLTAFASRRLGPVEFGARLSRDIGGGDGVVAAVSVGTGLPLGERLMLRAGVSAEWADSRYMEAFFGVSETQAARSGLARFHAGAGFKSVDLGIGATWLITDHWFLDAGGGIGRLVGDAADSPISARDTQPFASIMAGYRF